MYLINIEFRGYGRSALLFFELDAISNDIDVRQVHRCPALSDQPARGIIQCRQGSRITAVCFHRFKFLILKLASQAALIPNSVFLNGGGTALTLFFLKSKNHCNMINYNGLHFESVVWGGIEPPTQGFSVLCSTN